MNKYQLIFNYLHPIIHKDCARLITYHLYNNDLLTTFPKCDDTIYPNLYVVWVDPYKKPWFFTSNHPAIFTYLHKIKRL